MLLAVAEWVVDRCVDQVGGAQVISQMLLSLGDASMRLWLSIVQIIIVGVVGEDTVAFLHVVTVWIV